MPHKNSRPTSSFLISQLGFVLAYGMGLPLVVGGILEWGWMTSVPVAALWLWANRPLLETWFPEVLYPFLCEVPAAVKTHRRKTRRTFSTRIERFRREWVAWNRLWTDSLPWARKAS